MIGAVLKTASQNFQYFFLVIGDKPQGGPLPPPPSGRGLNKRRYTFEILFSKFLKKVIKTYPTHQTVTGAWLTPYRLCNKLLFSNGSCIDSDFSYVLFNSIQFTVWEWRRKEEGNVECGKKERKFHPTKPTTSPSLHDT